MNLNNYKNWLKYFEKIYYLFPLRKINLFFIFILLIILSIVELFGLSLVIPFVTSLLDKNGSIEFSKIYILDKFNFYDADINIIIILLIVVFSLKIVIAISIEATILNLTLKSRALLRSQMTYYYLNAKYENILKANSSDYINSIQSYCGQHRAAVLHLLKLLGELIFIFLVFCFLVTSYGFYSIVSILLIIILIYIFDIFTKKKVFSFGKQINEINAQIIKILNEAIYGFKEIKIYKFSKYFSDKLKTISLQHAKIDAFYEVLTKLPRFLFEYFIIIIFAITGFFIAQSDIKLIEIIPDISIIFLLVLRFIPLSTSLSLNISTLRHCKNGVDNLFDDYKLFSKDTLIAESSKNNNYGDTFTTLELENVDFKYPNSKENVLNSINLKINRGEFIGIIGSSGSGKTTLIDIFLGLLHPTNGKMILNGKKFEFDKGMINGFAAYIPQDNFILDDTITKNITFNFSDESVNFSKLDQVSKKTKIDEFINDLPNKYNTKLGEHGKYLSGGQKQRIAISRSLYLQKDLLILDESTNALDSTLEKEILEAISDLNKNENLTVIMISHNQNNLIYCDKKFRINKGKLSLFK